MMTTSLADVSLPGPLDVLAITIATSTSVPHSGERAIICVSVHVGYMYFVESPLHFS